MSEHKAAPSAAKRAIGSGLWTIAERVISQAGQLVVFILAARLLGPAEFGVFALVSACAILLLRVAEVGWAQYIMAWHGDDEVPRQVLMIAILAGAIMAVVGAMAGLGLPLFGVSQTTTILVILFSGWVLLAATSSANNGILVWQDRIQVSARCEIMGELCGISVAVAALYSGFGVFALVFGRLAHQSVHLLTSFIATGMTPLWGMDRAQIRALVAFSAQVFTGRMIINLRLYVGTFIIGGFLGPAAVGYYRAAERLVGALAEILGVPTQRLAWSFFREAREEGGGGTGAFQAKANLFFKVLMAISVPIFIWVAVVAEEIIVGLLGEEWLPALPLVAILAVARVAMLPGFTTEPVLSLAGKIKVLPKMAFLFLTMNIIFALAAAPFGVVAVAWGQLGVAFVIAGTTFWVFERQADIRAAEVFRGALTLVAPVCLGATVLILLVDSSLLAPLPAIVRAVVVSLPATLVYGIALVFCDPQVRSLALARLQRRPA